MSVPEWQHILSEAIQTNVKENPDALSYSLSTVNEQGVPQNRFVIHRGFVNDRRKEDDGSSNAIGDKEKLLEYNGPAILTTTDIRASKARELDHSNNVSIAWWLEHTGEQFRVVGNAYLVQSPESTVKRSKTDIPTSALPLAWQHGTEKTFDWEAERLRIFDKMSTTLRASYLRPPPGSQVDPSSAEKWREELGKDDKDAEDIKKALVNFALIVIEPRSIDWCRLKESPNKRTSWKLQGIGEWEKTELVP